ncbi:hypothetical protein IAT38_007848 [Cryptococcus sp. DSM 104549]
MSNNPLTPSSSRLPRPSAQRSSTPTGSSKYGSAHKHARSKSSVPHPKVLPFPDITLPLRSRDSSRAASPLLTPGDRLEVTFDQMVMMRTSSSDGGGHGGGRRSSGGSGTTTPVSASGPAFSGPGSTSPPVSSPLAIAAVSRARALTAPTSAVGSPSGGRSAPSPSPTPRRDTFQSSTPVRASTSVPTGSATSAPAVSAPTVAIAPPLPPIYLAPSAPIAANGASPAPPRSATPTQPRTPHSHSHAHGHTHSHNHTHTTTPHTPPSTTAVIPTSSLQPLSDHLYHSFLHGVCADVRLVIRKWGVCYHVHRMILSQASFFNSLFLGGFSEMAPGPRPSRKGKERATGKERVVTSEEWSGEDVELHFDDPNITRAAFEICLSRLYSPYPTLHYPTSLLPTALHPLTPSFPTIVAPISFPSLHTSVPPNSHLATPRLLLSLLATTIYLGHSTLLRDVLAMILRTVGPMTVGKYLAFAIGDGIGDEEWEDQSEECARGLHRLAKRMKGEPTYHPRGVGEDDEDEVENTLRSASHSPRLSSDEDHHKVSETDHSTRAKVPLPALMLPSRSNSVRSSVDHGADLFSFASADARSLPHFYGIVGNKIGEACVCWLARWGADLLHAEIETPNPSYRIWAHRGLPARFVRALLSSDYFFVKNEMERYRIARHVLDLRRRAWEGEMDSSGDLSLAGTELSDRGWEEWDEEERELQLVFAEGIRYCHMTFDDLSTIASDIDPHTTLPYAPLSVLQAAHWAAADLRARVTAHERTVVSTTPSPSSADDENELGLTETTSSIVAAINKRRRPAPRSRVPSPAATWGPSSAGNMPLPSPALSTFDTLQSSTEQRVWHPVPSDETHRIGASGLLSLQPPSVAGMQGVPDFGPDLLDVLPQEGNVASKAKPPPHGEKNFFGLAGGKATGSEIEEKWMSEGGAFAMAHLGLGEGRSKEDKWTKIEPFRFSVEFWDVDKLGEKERYYSGTHFYAGSLFNCYIQMIKRKEKGVQLGIYLHRQSPNEPFPAASIPRSSDTHPLVRSTTNMTLGPTPVHNATGSITTSPVIAGSPPSATPGSLGLRGRPPAASAESSRGSSVSTDSPYQDTRAVTKAFFSISCASALGTALIRFTSGPDSFAHSQSWGWKSSALKSEEYLSTPPPGAGEQAESLEEGVMGWSGEVDTSAAAAAGLGRCTLRATVVVGVV